MKSLTSATLSELHQKAAASPRLRSNYNLHGDLSDPIQRLAIAMEPGTYVRPHRHRHTFEVLLPLRGSFVIVCFDDAGTVTNRIALGSGHTSVHELDPGQWHAVTSLEKGSVIFEVKAGPYQPTTEADFANWSPPEGTPEAAKLVDWLAEAQVGDLFANRPGKA